MNYSDFFSHVGKHLRSAAHSEIGESRENSDTRESDEHTTKMANFINMLSQVKLA